jgi:hypothetical protein
MSIHTPEVRWVTHLDDMNIALRCRDETWKILIGEEDGYLYPASTSGSVSL